MQAATSGAQDGFKQDGQRESNHDFPSFLRAPFSWGAAFFRGGDAFGQPLQFIAVQNFGVDHADEQRLDGSCAEPVHNAFDGTSGYALPRFGGAIEKGAVFDGVSEVALLLKPPQDGANGRVLEGAPKFLADLFRGQGSFAPNDEENTPFELSQFAGVVIGLCVTCHSVTKRNTWNGPDVKGGAEIFLRG